MRIAPKLIVSAEDRKILERWARGRSTPVRLMQRARIVLLAAEGRQNKDIAGIVGVTRQLVGRWRNRYLSHGLSGIETDSTRSGRKPVARDAVAR